MTDRELLHKALDALSDLIAITNDSRGVTGYHLNGDIAEWDEFDEIDVTTDVMAAIRDRLAEPEEAVEPVTLDIQDIANFAGWLTCRPGLLEVGAAYDAAPMAEALKKYEETFPDRFAPRPAVRLSKDELEAILSDWMLNGGKSSREIYENVQTAVLKKNGLTTGE